MKLLIFSILVIGISGCATPWQYTGLERNAGFQSLAERQNCRRQAVTYYDLSVCDDGREFADKMKANSSLNEKQYANDPVRVESRQKSYDDN